jgi:hypothetical protein
MGSRSTIQWIALLGIAGVAIGCGQPASIGSAFVPADREDLRRPGMGRDWPRWSAIQPAKLNAHDRERLSLAYDATGLYGRISSTGGGSMTVQIESFDATDKVRGMKLDYQPPHEPGRRPALRVAPLAGAIDPDGVATRTWSPSVEADVHGGEFWISWRVLGVAPGEDDWSVRIGLNRLGPRRLREVVLSGRDVNEAVRTNAPPVSPRSSRRPRTFGTLGVTFGAAWSL